MTNNEWQYSSMFHLVRREPFSMTSRGSFKVCAEPHDSQEGQSVLKLGAAA